jgi:hypothetical protein
MRQKYVLKEKKLSPGTNRITCSNAKQKNDLRALKLRSVIQTLIRSIDVPAVHAANYSCYYQVLSR